MAEFTLDQIEAAVRFRGDYQSERKFTKTDLQREIQSAFGEFYAVVDSVHEGYWDTTGDKTTTASTGYVALPLDCWRVRQLGRVDGNDFIPLIQVGSEALARFGLATGKPIAYRLTARGADLYHIPDAAYTLRFVYTPKAPQLHASQPRDWFNGWEEFVIEATLLRLDKADKKPVGDRMNTLYHPETGLKARIKAEAGERRSQEPEYLKLREYDGIADIYEDGI